MKKKLFATILVSVMIAVFFGTGAYAAGVGDTLSVSARVDGMDIYTVTVEGENYLFLPASADLNKLVLHFEQGGAAVKSVRVEGENGSATVKSTLSLLSVAGKDKDSCYVISAVAENGESVRVHIMQGAGISTLYLSSDKMEQSRTWVDSSRKNEATGEAALVDANGDVLYDGALTQIKARGNSTFVHYPKKAYQIKLEKKADLLGNGEKAKTWVLLANYGDATLMHDKLFKDLAEDLGMDYVASCEWVNLYYDGEYRGVYLLGEKNSVGSTSVDITDMEEAYEAENEHYGDDMEIAEAVNEYGQTYQYTKNLTEPENITGGWLIEKNHNFIDEASGFFTAKGMGFNVKSPEWAGQEAMEYISEYYQAFENAVYATKNGSYTGYNAETGKYYYEYCDLDSLVKVFLIQELGLNPDGFISSLYFYKDADGIMYAGPVWDQDMTLGTGWTKYISPQIVDYHYLAEALIQIPHFKAAVEEYFTYTFAPEVEELLGSSGTIAGHRDALAVNAAMNYVLWPYIRVGSPAADGHLWKGTNYYGVTANMETWLSTRLSLLKKTFEFEDGAKNFKDLKRTDWEYEAVRFAVSHGILNGVSADQFDPDGTATRGMLLTVLARMAGQDTTPGEGESWMQPGLDWAMANGISDGANPDAAITREQLATMLYRYADAPAAEATLDGFADGGSVSAWATDAMKWAVAEGIFRGDGAGRLNPKATASRAEIAQVMMNFMAK